MASVIRWWHGLGHNVKLNFIYNALSSCAQSIISGSSTMAAYIYFLEGSGNSADDVGFVSATAGVVMVILSLPVGYYTDKTRRDYMLKASGILGLLTSGVLAVALALDSMPALYAFAAVNGAYSAANGPALSALFADSVPTGGRTALYTANYAVSLAAGGIGPLIALVIMLLMGNEWKTPQLRAVMWSGLVLNALSCIALPFFDDDKALGQGSEGVLATVTVATGGTGTAEVSTVDIDGAGTRGRDAKQAPLLANDHGADTDSPDDVNSDSGSRPASSPGVDGSTAGSSDPSSADAKDGDNSKPEGGSTMNLGHQTVNLAPCLSWGCCRRRGCCGRAAKRKARPARPAAGDGTQGQEDDSAGHDLLEDNDNVSPVPAPLTLRVSHIPWLIFTSDFLIAIGAGMTVQYFALFFANVYQLPPVEVSSIYTASPVLIALLSGASGPLSKVIGRAWTAVLCDGVGTACLFCLWARLPVGAAIPLYLLRTSAMNASYPVQRAILMDVVPKSQRGFWNSLEGLTSFTWTGSAALGGLLIDKYGYGYTFFITAGIYTVATALLMLLVPLTAGEQPDGPAPAKAVDGQDEGEAS